MSNKTVNASDVSNHLIQDIRQIINRGRTMAYASVNAVLIDTYWKIGQRIVEEEQHGSKRAEYGTGLLKKLAQVLSAEFGNNYDVRNLRNFRQFYLLFPILRFGTRAYQILPGHIFDLCCECQTKQQGHGILKKRPVKTGVPAHLTATSVRSITIGC